MSGNPWDADPIVGTPAAHTTPWASDPVAGAGAARAQAPWAADPIASAPAGDSTAVDVAKSIGSSLVRGVTGFAMAPAAIAKFGADTIVDNGEWLARKALGLGDVTPETQAARDQAQKDMAARAIVPAPQDATAAIRGVEDTYLHTPQTTAGKFAGTIAEMVPAVVGGPGGLLMAGGRDAIAAAPSVAGKAWEAAKPLLVGAVAPGVASEGAGELAAGKKYEGAARVAGGLLGNAAAVVPSMSSGAVDRIIAKAVTGTDPAVFQQAQVLQQRAAAMGVPLSGPEAIQAASQGATKLGDVQRVVEGSTNGGARTGQFYAQRPDQVAAAAGSAFDTIAPVPGSATLAGMAGQQAATDAVRAAERYRTAQTGPLYDAAGSARLSPDDMGQLMSDMRDAMAADRTGVTSAEIGRLHDMLIDQQAQPGTPGTPATRTPVMGPNGQPIRYETTPATPGTPDQPMQPVTDLANANRARKAMRERLDMPVAPGRDPITAEQQHAVGPFMDRLSNLMEGASPDFRAANQAYGRISDEVVNPVVAGPVGAISRTGDVGQQGRALLPDVPAEGSATDAAIATALLARQDPDAAATLIRSRLGQQFAESTQDNMGGPNQFGGAKFAAAMTGNRLQEDTLRAALGALPQRASGAEPLQRLNDLFQVLSATGWRKPQGSATEFNRQMAAEMGHQGVPAAALQAVATGGLAAPSLMGKIAEASRQHALDRNSGALASLFLDPNSAAQIGAIAAQGARSPLVDMFRRQAIQTPGEAR